MRDLILEPAWRPEDLGMPLPDSEHAVSVAMPLWEHVIGYEEENPAVIDRLQCGYPRFFCHPAVRRLFRVAGERLGASPDEEVLVFPSARAAERCVQFVGRGRAGEFGGGDLRAVVVPGADRRRAHEYWRYSGEIVSSRMAGAALAGDAPGRAGAAHAEIRDRLAGLAGQDAEDVFLFGTGMAATFTAHRVLRLLRPGLKSMQLEFPYVDVLKVLEEFGAGARFFPVVGEGEMAEALSLLRGGEAFAGIFCELASNPLMRSIDLESLRAAAVGRDTPVVIDDTVASVANADVFPFADLVTTSLTKYFAGSGDVMGGSVIVNRRSPFAGALRALLMAESGAPLAPVDAAVLAVASRDYPERLARANANAEALHALFSAHPKVERSYYAGGETREHYEQIRRPGGGYGGLLSVVLKDGGTRAPRFHDALRVSKGPSFGTRFTLACPYTLLAHYGELDWAERCGVSRWLVRVGAGTEETQDLAGRFEAALEEC
ncbi:PLP-dependent transferase [soil metagenome]